MVKVPELQGKKYLKNKGRYRSDKRYGFINKQNDQRISRLTNFAFKEIKIRHSGKQTLICINCFIFRSEKN